MSTQEFNVASKWTSLVAVELREKAGAGAAATLVVGGSQPKPAAAEDAGHGGPRRNKGRRRDRAHAHAHAHNHARGGGGGRRGAQYAVAKGAPTHSTSAPRAAAGPGFAGDPFASIDGGSCGRAVANARNAAALRLGGARTAIRRSAKETKKRSKNAVSGFAAAPPPPPGPAALSRQSSAERAAVSPCIFDEVEDDDMGGAMDMFAAASFAPAVPAPGVAAKSFFASAKPAAAPAPVARARHPHHRAKEEAEVDTSAAAIPGDLFFAAAEEESKTVADAPRPAQGSMDVFAAIVAAQQANGTPCDRTRALVPLSVVSARR